LEGRDGTVVGDEVEYEIGFGAVGALLEKVIFQRMMAAIFEHRKKALDRVFAAEFAQASGGVVGSAR
jgi:ligand-binding SRPBCC domain-containing protein